tara:strand:- start:1017 stop:1499 length:483 start_codon:yes stop_codon:yes gene_type:complete
MHDTLNSNIIYQVTPSILSSIYKLSEHFYCILILLLPLKTMKILILMISFLYFCTLDRVLAGNYLCDPWTNTLTLLKEKNPFTASLDGGALVFRSGSGLPEGVPKFSQLSYSLPNYDLFVTPNGTLVTASPITDTSFRVAVYFPYIDRRWFWFSKCRLTN